MAQLPMTSHNILQLSNAGVVKENHEKTLSVLFHMWRSDIYEFASVSLSLRMP